MPDRRLPAGKMSDGDGETAFELVVIVAVEDVVLAVVLVVDDRLRDGEARAEKRAFFSPLAAFVDQRLQTGTVSTRLRAEDAVTGAA